MNLLQINAFQNDSFNCLQSIIAIVARYYNLCYEMMFYNTWSFGFQIESNNSSKRLGDRLEYGWKDNFVDVLEKYHGLKLIINYFKDINEVISIITREINCKQPIAVYIDSYYCPWNPGYGKYHITHYCLIVGMEKDNDILLCIDPYFSDKVEKLPIYDLSRGFSYYISFSRIHCNKQNESWSGLLLETIKKSWGDNKKSSIFYLMRRFAEEVGSNIDIDEEIYGYDNIRFLPLTRKVLEIGKGRKNYTYTLNYISNKYGFKELDEYVIRIAEIAKQWQAINICFIKAFIAKEATYALSVASSKIKKIADCEEETSDKLYQLLYKS